MGGNASVGPDVEHQLIIVGVLTHAGVVHRILHASDWAVDGVDRDDADGHIRALVFFPGGETAADAHFEFAVEFDLAVQVADDEVFVDDFVVIVILDVACGDAAVFFDGDGQEARLLAFAVVMEAHLFQIQDDLNDVFDDARDSGELVFNTANLHRSDGGTFQGGEEHAADGVSEGMAVTFVKRLGDELSVGLGGRGLVFDETVRHFESGETSWHVGEYVVPGYLRASHPYPRGGVDPETNGE